MDEDNCDGPFTVWQMFNAPTMVLFNNLENAAEGLERLLTSILKLSGDFSEVLIPRVGSTKCPDSYYCAFNTWLLGRLFYVCSVKELNMIHGSSKDAQVKILNILCVNGASFYEKLILQYHSILFALVKYYKENSDSLTPGEILLDNFKPEQIDIPNVQLNLEPISVQVKNINTCTLLINFLLQLLSECIPPYLLNIDKFSSHLQKLLSDVLFMLEHYSIEVKLLVLNFFANLINNTNNSSGIHFQSSFPQIYKKLLYCMECMVQNIDILFEKGNITSDQLTNFNNVIIKLLKTCDISYNANHKDVLSTISITILKNTSNPVFNKELKLYCLSLSNTVNFPKDVLELEKRNSKEIDMLADCYYKHILEYIKQEKCQTNELKDFWFFKQVVNVIFHSLEFSNNTRDATTLSFNLMRHLSALNILQKVFINYKKNNKDNSNIIILEQTNLNKTFEMLSELIKTHDYILLQDSICMSLFLNIVLTTTSIMKCINENIKMESFPKSRIMQMLCLQESLQNIHKILSYNECTKVLILKYILLTRLILNTKENDIMERVILNLVDTILKNKNSTTYKETNNNEVSTQSEYVFPLCINLLVKLTQTSLESNNSNKQIATLEAIKEFGFYCNNIALLPVTKLFIYFIMHPQCAVAPKAEVYLREICEFHGYTPNQVYHRYKKDYCRLFVECSLYCGKDFAISLLKVVRAFGFVGYRDFISKDVHHFLPYLIPYSVTIPEVPSMIEEIASLVQCSVSDFIIERFPLIYVHVYLNENNAVADKCYSVLERLTKCSILSLIKKHFRVILTEFLLQYSCNPEKVLNACRYLACHDPDATPSGSMKMSTTQIADFLNPKFLGVLAYFDHKLVNAKVALSVKRKALKSFPDMMQLMGVKYITPLRFKVLATLRSALPLVKEFPKILADAWSAFIHNLDSISLGPLLSNLAVSLLQQFEYAPQEINKIFQYLVLKNENLLSAHLSDLFFLGDSNISEKVKAVIKRHVIRTQPEGFLDKIKWYLEHLNNEIPRIKAYAISHLDVLLKNNRSEIHKAIFGGKNIDPIIVELIDCLLLGCKDPDSKVSEASGSCLGQLGAIEAGHLPRQYVQPDRSPFAFTIVDNCFAATALVELSRAFQYEKDTTNMDCYALTIQEILKTYEISPTGSKKEVWDSFPENMHQIMYPLLSSRYTLAYPSQPKKIHPLFGSVHATTFLEWAHNWTGQLISIIKSESIRDLLRTVHPSMRRDLRTLLLFFPYVLLHAIVSKTDTKYIQEEIMAVIGRENLDAENNVRSERTYKMLRHIRMTPNINSVQAEEGNQSKCSKTIYSLFDFLNRWLLEWCHVKQRPTENENYKAIKSFMDNFDKLTIARGSFACGELERALQYLELYMDERKERVQEQLPLLAEIYALLDEPDSVAGILSIKRSEPSLKELILAQVVTGRLQDAALCYERLAQEGQLDRNSMQGMIDCYLSLDQPFTAHRLLSERDSDDMTELAAEPLWRLGRFEELDRLAEKPVPPSRENWGLLMGRVLLAYRKQDHDAFILSCKDATSKLLSQMDGKSRGESALRSGYQSVLGLHIVKEAEHAEEVLCRLKNLRDGDDEGEAILSQLLDEWRRRLAVVQSDVRTVEPLLRLRRILLQQTQELLEPTHPMTSNRLKASIGDLWLQSAKHARKAGIYQQSYMYILNAEEYHPEELFIEKSKMYWARGQQEHAFTTLRRGLDETYPQIDRLTQQQSAKAKLLIAKYNDETTKVDVDVNIGYYKESVEVFKQWEKSLVCLGAYYEKVSSNDTTPNSMTWSRRIQALNSYGKALQYGHKYLYQSMPRMLSIWLDMEVTSADTGIHTVLAQMTEIIKTYSERLPIYLYLTAFSQIISRICHPVREVYLQLKAIIVKLILAYPQHTLWMMMCVIKSSYPQRIKRCSDVFSDPRLKETHMLKLVADFNQFAERLIELCNKPISGNNTKPTVSSLVRTLPRLLDSDNFSRIMIPFEEFCKIVLPSKAARQERIDFNIPKEPAVYIAGIDEDIQILPSLQKPRKVTLKGSDGKSYIILLKSRDDLRKDFRLMEFNGVVNRFLQDAAETRRRRLYIRTYCVLPLNEECGLIQWVPNLLGLRPILLHIYKQKGIHTTNRELKELMCSKNDPLDKMRRIFEQYLLRKHPPVFQEWFRRVFSDPYGWFSSAIISNNNVIGLGDRHGENISFDSTNGDTVHVDFNCLFNKGETFEWPERVPFRLTHNMEAAMGPLKHEGMFRVLQEASVSPSQRPATHLQFLWNCRCPWASMNTLVFPLLVRTKNKKLTLSLSPEGQVEHLIVEATSVQNLCQMYIGWGPFL
ncbi:Serine/threonine-protein kinase ATR [Papilio machaon]|uniref:non-specific serine/threonine protein kinase n=1 Tax=Papilio machaon TaxID=76193 RepID=A0A0N1IAI7_PAPMA|nr:Serine/threonine-protein kinase ATR [Papilio machaon]